MSYTVASLMGGPARSRRGPLVLNSEFVYLLQIQPELGAGAKEVCQPKGCVAGNRTPSVEDFGDAVGRDGDLSGERRSTHAEFMQFFG